MGTIIRNGIEYGGGISPDIEDKINNAKGIELTQAEYNALSEEEQKTGLYWITDADSGSSSINALTSDDVVDNLESTATDLPLSANMGRELKVKTKYVKSQLTTSVYGYYYFDETTKIYTGTTKIPIPEDAIEILGVLPGSCYSLTSDSKHHYPFECVYYNGEISCAAYSPTSQTLEFGVTILYR